MAFDPDAYLADKATEFDPDAYLASKASLTPTAVADTGGEGDGFLAKINAALRKPSPEYLQAPEQAVRELVGGMVPQDLESYAAGIFPPLAAFKQGQQLAQGDVSSIPFVGRIPEIAQAEDTPAGSKERYLTAMKTLMDVGMLAGAGGEGGAPVETPSVADMIRTGRASTLPPPIPPQYQGRFTTVPPPPEQPPQLAPAPPIEQTLANMPQQMPFNPELGPMPQMQPDFQMPLQTEFGRLPGGADLQLSPPPGTDLKPIALRGPNGGTPALDAITAQPQPQGVQLPVSPEGGAPLIPPGDERYAGVTPQTGTAPVSPQEAPIGAANRIARAREQAGLTEAPPPGIGQSWHESVAQGNALIDKGADAYKVVSDFQKTRDISGVKMSVARAWLERLQRANQEARGALEQDPTNPTLAQNAQNAESAENAYWQGYQPMKTEWSKIGTGMQEQRGITDSDLLNQKTAEQVMRENIERELTATDKARAAKAVKDTRAANAKSDAAFDKAIGEASRKAKGPTRSLEQLKNDLAAKLKELTPC